MATIASLNVLLNLNSSGFMRGVGQRIQQIQEFARTVEGISQATGVSSRTVTRAIQEEVRVRDNAAREQTRLRDEAARAEKVSNEAIYRENVQRAREQTRLRDEAARAEKVSNEAIYRENVQRAREQTRLRDEAARAEKVSNEAIYRENVQRARQEVQQTRQEVQQTRERQQAMQKLALSVGGVGLAFAGAASSAREMLVFSTSRVTGALRVAFDGIAQAIGGIIGPTERVGATVRAVVAGAGTALGGLIGGVSDAFGSIVSMIGSTAGKLAAGLLIFIPIAGPILAGIALLLGEIVSLAGAAIGAVGRLLGEIVGGAARVLGEVLGGVASALVQLGSAAVATFARFEHMEVAFAVMTGSAAKARALFEDLANFAAVTPFELKDLTGATQRLLAYGFATKDVLPMMQRLGDMAAAMPEGIEQGLVRIVRALGQMRSHGKVHAQEMNQLAEAGVPAWQALADYLTNGDVPRAMQLVHDRAVTAAQGIQAVLNAAASPRFAGVMAAQMDTVTGLWSNLKDNVTRFLGDLGKMIVGTFDLKNTLRGATDFFAGLRQNLEQLRPLLTVLGGYFQAIRDIVVELAKMALEWAASLGVVQGRMGDVRSAALETMRAIALGIITAAEKATNFVNQVIEGVKNLGDLLYTLVVKPIKTLIVDLARLLQLLGVESAKTGGIFDTKSNMAVGRGIVVGALGAAGRDVAEGKLTQKAPNPFDQARAGINAHFDALQSGSRLVAQGIIQAFRYGAAWTNAIKQVVQAWEGMPKGKLGLDPEITKVIEKARTPLQEFQAEMRKLNDLVEKALPGAFFSASGAIGGFTAHLVESVQATDALRLRQAQLFNELRKKTLGKVGDVASMEKGSKEAGTAINRAVNQQANAQQDAAAELKIIQAIEKQQVDQLKDIAEQLKVAGKNLGLW